MSGLALVHFAGDAPVYAFVLLAAAWGAVAFPAFGAGSLFVYTAVAHGLLLLFAVIRTVAPTVDRHEEQIEYGDALAAVQTASQVYEEIVWQKPEDVEDTGGSI